MPQPYAWLKLQNAGTVNVSPRAGHTITNSSAGFILYGGMDGRRNDQGNPSPNSDLYILKLTGRGVYEWQMAELDPASAIPPARTLHTCSSISEDEVFVFGGIHSATPYQCLADGWILDTTCMEWKKVQFKAAVGGVKGSFSRRMTGTISERPLPNTSKGGGGAGGPNMMRRRSTAGRLAGSKITFESLAGAASSAMLQHGGQSKDPRRASLSLGMAAGARNGGPSGGAGKKLWKGILQKKMTQMLKAPTSGGAPRASLKQRGFEAGDEDKFHNDLVNMVSHYVVQEMVQEQAKVVNIPAPRANHTLTFTMDSQVVLFGGHGGVGYTRKAFNDSWVLNLDNDRWTELLCQGNPPAARSGHSAFSKDGMLFVFGGWNNESQFNDLFLLDVENKDWSDIDLSWSVPRWNHSMQLAEAIPSWRVFVFGGACDKLSEGRALGQFDNKIGVLNLGVKYKWDDPELEMKPDQERPPSREHSAICYDPEESRLLIIGGWSNKWLDDVWQINISSIVGPPYAIASVDPPLGPVTGAQKIIVRGVGFNSTHGQAVVRFITPKHYADTQGTVINDEIMECMTPNVVQSIGPKDCEVRLAIGVRDFTTTKAKYLYFLNTIAEKSLCYGPGLQEEGSSDSQTRFTIVARNNLGENRKSGRDDFTIVIQQKLETGGLKEVPHEFIDFDNGKYEVRYQCDAEVVIHVKLIDENNKPRPVRGSPFSATFTALAKNRANEYTGPLMHGFTLKTLKDLEELYKATDAGINAKLKEGDVKGLIKIKNFITTTYEREQNLLLLQDEVYESLMHLEREGLPTEKQLKMLKKVGENIELLKVHCKKKEKEIAPLVQKESDIYRKKIAEYEEELKVYQSGLKKEAYFFYKSGLELAKLRLREVTMAMDKFDLEKDDLYHIACNFEYPDELNNSKKIMQAMREDVAAMETLWNFEEERIRVTETFLINLWGKVQAGDMEDRVKELGKELRSLKVDKKCDAFTGMQDVVKKWSIFCPLVGELRDPAMRGRHWSQLMNLCGKSVEVSEDILLRDMWNMELHKFPDAVEDTADQAKQEAKMEITLNKLKECWGVVEFGFDPHKTGDMMLMKIKDEDFEMLEEHQLGVQNMFASRFLSTFETEVVFWQKTLANISEVSTVLSEVQRSWSFLENLFIHSEEVKKELPDESERFVTIDMEVKELLKKGESVRIAKDFCNEEGMFQRFEKCQTNLTMCEKALNDFMDGKRRAFPRFYFMSSADLLDVLSNGNQPVKVVPQFSKFFNAINSYSLEFPDGEAKRPHATGMEASIGKEYVPFPEALPLVGKVEIYLERCIEAFRDALRYFAKEDIIRYKETNCETDGECRGIWITKCVAAQGALLVNLVMWCDLVENAFSAFIKGNEKAVEVAATTENELLISLIKLTMTDLDKPTRQKVMCMITLDAHNRDVLQKLVRENVNNRDAFQWQSMLKCYWLEDVDDAQLQIADARLMYGYEYLGNGPRLVVTPLTDRIYVTATQALHLCMGCAPAGPAGTGKTESTKDLANAVAKACYVINAAPEMDYLTMGNVFKGLAASGSWGCFDEFNRLVPEVLSVCTVQFKAVCDAVKTKAKRFILQGDEINLDVTVGVYITMNPGYLGRSELPEGLKALFRPITVMVPDFMLIIENMCMGEGFKESKALGLKFSTLYFLNADLLSKSNKYDWGMRAIKSVLVVAGGYMRADPDLAEQGVLMRSLRDTNVGKIDGDDLKIFMGLLLDLFPGINVPRGRDYDFEAILVATLEEDFGYTQDTEGYLLLKITQLVELLGIRHCVFLMGNPGSFKSFLWKVLAKAKTRVGDKTTIVDFSPKAISTNELYGYVNMATREWKDGILSKTMRDLGQIPDTMPKWILLDGDLDANWIESMNSVMDDNRLLTLPSNERIVLKGHMKLIFEIRDLNYATPATATRAGIVCMVDYEGVQWRAYVTSWVKKLTYAENVKDQLMKLFEKYSPDVLLYILKYTKIQVPMVDIAMIMIVCHLLDSLLAQNLDCIEYWFVFCMIFAVGGCLTEVDGVDYKKAFSTFWKNEMKTIKYPSKGTVFDYFVNDSKLDEWQAILKTIEYSSETPMNSVTVPTTETVAMTYIMKALIGVHETVMLIGLSGCGKTQSCNGLLQSLDPEQFVSYSMNMNFYTDSNLLQTCMEIPLEKKAGRLYAPPGKSHLIYFIDDLNLPALDNYNTQSGIELMRQKQDYNHWFDRTKITLKDIGNTQYLCCMNPTAGSFVVNPRLQRHFWTCAVSFPEQGALQTIYATFMKGHFERLGFKAGVQEVISSIIKATLSLHAGVSSCFRKTAANFHYEFNIRHLSGVFAGLTQAKPSEFTDAEKLTLLWIHEAERVYGDRLVSVADLRKYRAICAEMSKKMFKFNFTKYFQEKNPETLCFAPFSKGLEAMESGAIYDKIPNVEKMNEILVQALQVYNDNNAAMDLVLFEDAMKHVGKITRIVGNASGHALLVGVGGSGRQSLSRLSCFIMQCTTMMIVISGTYGLNDLKGDLQIMYNKAGVKDEGVMFLFTDGQITNEKFLVFINDLLASGEIADLYATEDKDVIRNAVRGGCKSYGMLDTPENLWTFFIMRIRRNLHMSICFSPVGDGMRNRSRKFPALVNCTVIDWFQPWPKDALYEVAKNFLSPIEELGDENDENRAAIVEFFPYSFDLVDQQSAVYLAMNKRYAYSTPKSFLELMKLYINILKKNFNELSDKQIRLTNGLDKLKVTQEAVAELEDVLKEKAVVVKEKATAADAFAEEVGREKVKVGAEADKANVEALKCAEISTTVTAQKQSCESDLAAAVPLVEQAEAALDVLNKKDFQELKSLGKPPAGVDLVMEAVMHLSAGIDPLVDVDKKGKAVFNKDGSWKNSQKVMGNPEKFLENLKSFTAEINDGNVPLQNVESARKIQISMGEDFSFEGMKKKSGACAGLCEWVINIIMYYDVVTQIEPKRIALREALATLEAAETKLAEVNALVAVLDAKLAKLVSEFDAAMSEKNAVMAEAQKCQSKLDMAQRLVGALGANGIIWEQTVQTVSRDLVFVPGEVLVACGFASYLGVFTREYRVSITESFVGYLRKRNVPLGDAPDPLATLSTEAEIAMWGTQGLPSDRVSCENGAIMNCSERWSLIIDPQQQGIVWIKNKEQANNLQVTRMGHPKMVPTFEGSLDNGKSVLLENMLESVDAVLQPIIARNTIRRGKNRVIKLGEKEINFHSSFKLFLQTKLSNPHYPPEVQAETTVINFTVTEAGLEDQLLFLVVRLERPDLAKLKSDLIQMQNEFKVKLAELELLLLEKLANAEGDILDDVDLILTLEDAKKTSDEVKEKFIISQETEARINETSENYRPTANRGALLFFLLMDLCKMHSFYKYSLDSFIMVITRALESVSLRPKIDPKKAEKEKAEAEAAAEAQKAEKKEAGGGEGDENEEEEDAVADDEPAADAAEEAKEPEIVELTGKDLLVRVQLLTRLATLFAFDYTRRGLMDKDKLTVAVMLCLRVLVRSKVCDPLEVDGLIIAPLDPNVSPAPENARSWLTDNIWQQLKYMENFAVFKSTSGALTQNIEQDSLGWKRWYAEERAETADLPRSFRDLSTFHRVMLLRVLRPDRLGSALSQFVIDNLGIEYIEQQPFNMPQTYDESTCLTPFFFVLFPGTDPTPVVEGLARKLGFTEANGRFVNISMGQGQEVVAISALNKAGKEGGWILLQNVHLMQSWLKTLERSLEIVEEFAHTDFRCVVTSEPPSALMGPLAEVIPEPILQKCIKIADEAPQDIKSNLRRAYSKFTPEDINECLKPKEFKACLFALCFFHSLISGRIKFGAQGWSRKYPFNDGDLTICGAVLKNYLNAAEKLGTEVPWPDLRYIFGEIMYGGHITDFWDRRVNNTYLAVYVVPDLLANMNLAPGFKSPDAAKLDYQQYVKYVDERFPPETPMMFGMHVNAEIGYLTNQGIEIFNTISNVRGGSSGGGGGDLGSAQPIITNYLGLLPPDFDMIDIRSKLKEEDYTPYVIVSLQESDRMNILLNVIRNSLLELELGISGALNVTDKMEGLAGCLNFNKVFDGWTKFAYSSLKSLALWFGDLVKRVSQLDDWTKKQSLLKSIWLSGMFNPMAFMTAVKQVTARSTGLPLDFMFNRWCFTNAHDQIELPAAPAEGVYLHGLCMEGSGWEEGKGDDEGYITDSKLKDLHPFMPIANVFSVHMQDMSWVSMYTCPIFVNSLRGATFVVQSNVRMDPDDDDKRWILAGAAMLLADD